MSGEPHYMNGQASCSTGGGTEEKLPLQSHGLMAMCNYSMLAYDGVGIYCARKRMYLVPEEMDLKDDIGSYISTD